MKSFSTDGGTVTTSRSLSQHSDLEQTWGWGKMTIIQVKTVVQLIGLCHGYFACFNQCTKVV